MLRIRIFLGYLLSLVLIWLPIAVFWVTFTGPSTFAWIASSLMALGIWVTVWVRADVWLSKRHSVLAAPSGMEASLQRAVFEAGLSANSTIRLGALPDPAPNALVWRAPGKGTRILLSQGLLERLDEEELRAVLVYAVRRSRLASLPVTTFVVAIATWLLAFAPASWTDALISTRSGENPKRPLMTVPGFLIFSFLTGYSGCFLGSVPRERIAAPSVPAFESACLKMNRASTLWGLRWVSGAARLHLFAPLPGPQSDLMSLSSA